MTRKGKFEWDYKKNLLNREKHKIIFEEAIKIFKTPRIEKIIIDDKLDEIRYITIGKLGRRFVSVVYTLRGKRIRIISARKARENEKEAYREIIDV